MFIEFGPLSFSSSHFQKLIDFSLLNRKMDNFSLSQIRTNTGTMYIPLIAFFFHTTVQMECNVWFIIILSLI